MILIHFVRGERSLYLPFCFIFRISSQPVALRRITPAVVQSIQVFFRLCCMQVYLFLRSISSPGCIAAACQPGGDDPDAGADCLSHLPLQWVRAGARWLLAEMLLFLSLPWWLW